jgi:hypothetical protein
MRNFESANLGLVEMNEEEMNRVDGGVIGIDDLILLGAGLALSIIYDIGKNDGAKNRNK